MHVLQNVYGRILRHLREVKGRSQADVAKAVSISPAHLARLEAGSRGLYLEDFVRIAEELGEKPGNLLSNDVGDIAHVKPLVDRLAAVEPDLMPRVVAILGGVVSLAEMAASPQANGSQTRPRRAIRGKGRS